MTNSDTAVARRFHDRTAHSRASVRASTHTLDWDNKPFPYKVYPDLPVIELPRTFEPVAVDAFVALTPAESVVTEAPITLETLASVLFLSAGLTKTKTYPGGAEVHFRAAPSTGALYQTEVYLVAGRVEGLAAGVYHFCPGDFRLRRLRAGDYRAVLADAAADPAVGRRPAVLVLTAIYWRNTWKYQARGYRHLFWDSGTMLANLLTAADALGLDPRLLAGFVDAEIDALLGLDSDAEASLELVLLAAATPTAPAAPPIETIIHATVPLSRAAVDYPMLREIHGASSLASPSEVRAWRDAEPLAPRSPSVEAVTLPAPRRAAGRSFSDTVLRRGSTRQFSHEPITAIELSTALFLATRRVPADFPTGLVALFVVIHAVEGIEGGAYTYDPEAHGLRLVRLGSFRSTSAYLCLEQALGGDAAATIYFLSPLDAILRRWGNRGYRLANLQAGLSGGRAYLAAYAQGFGATGLTFYDRDVIAFFEPASAGLDAVFVTALGRSAQAPRDGRP